jgi:CCR4-NOT transcription complex subunit 3
VFIREQQQQRHLTVIKPKKQERGLKIARGALLFSLSLSLFFQTIRSADLSLSLAKRNRYVKTKRKKADLKKELKKLQKFRDQIKNWSADTLIKDKTALNEYKRKIEIDMERFKMVERQSKTKAFSKHGLEKMENETAEQKRRRETKEWLSACVEELSNQSDAFEAEIEVLQSEATKPSKRKGKNASSSGNEEKVQRLEESVQRHKAHTLNLEIMMRLVENETLPAEEADDVRDLIEDYLERNQEDFDEFDVVNDMYESLNLEELATKESVKVVTNVKQLHEESGGAGGGGGGDSYPAGPPPGLQTAASSGGGSSKIEPPKPRVVPPAPVMSPKAATAAQQQEQQNVNQWGSRFPAPKGLDADGVGSGNGGNNAAVGSNAAAGAAGKPIPRPNSNSANVLPGVGSIKDGNAAQQAFPPGPRPLSSDANQQQSVAEAANAAFTANEVFDNPSQGARSLNEMSTAMRRELSGTSMQSGSGSAQSINNASNNSINSSLTQQQQQQQQQQRQQQQQQQQQRGGAASTATVAHGDPSSRLRLLEASASSRLLPSASDGVWTRRVRRAPQAPIPPSYPTSLVDGNGNNLYPVLENPALFERLDADALFFSFYHQQGTPQQYLAARELKRANWRFHKKYSAWFARREEPKVSNEEFEQGAYVYFDHAVSRDEYGSVRGWCQRSKPDFLFEYSHLENELQ